MRKHRLLKIDLHLFDGAAGGAPAGDGGEAAQAAESALPKAETKLPGRSRRGKSGEFDNVVFGKQEDAPAAETAGSDAGGDNGEGNANKSGVSTTSDTLEARRKAFKEMIDGEYKDVFAEQFQLAFNRRFKETKGMEDSLNAQKPIMDILMQRYNVADGDVKKLLNAIEQDNVYWESAADEAGLTVEQFKAMKKLERENAEFQRMRQRQQGEQAMQNQLSKWYAEADKLKEVYPTFDFKMESADRDFLGLLKSGLNVQQAYELKHMEEIKANAARAAAQTAGQQMAAKIQSRASRPKENGTSSQSAVIVKNDVHSLTRAERAEAVRRAQRGEIIRW